VPENKQRKKGSQTGQGLDEHKTLTRGRSRPKQREKKKTGGNRQGASGGMCRPRVRMKEKVGSKKKKRPPPKQKNNAAQKGPVEKRTTTGSKKINSESQDGSRANKLPSKISPHLAREKKPSPPSETGNKSTQGSSLGTKKGKKPKNLVDRRKSKAFNKKNSQTTREGKKISGHLKHRPREKGKKMGEINVCTACRFQRGNRYKQKPGARGEKGPPAETKTKRRGRKSPKRPPANYVNPRGPRRNGEKGKKKVKLGIAFGKQEPAQ